MPRVTRKKGVKRNGKKMTKHLNKKRHTLRKKRYFKKYRTRRIKRGGLGTLREEGEEEEEFGFGDTPTGSLKRERPVQGSLNDDDYKELLKFEGWDPVHEAALNKQQAHLKQALKPTSTPFNPKKIKGTPGKSVRVKPIIPEKFKGEKGPYTLAHAQNITRTYTDNEGNEHKITTFLG